LAGARKLDDTAYVRGLRKTKDRTLRALNPHSLSETGLPQRAALTVDMCQSVRPWEGAFFDDLVARARAAGRPFPVGIAMTGLWLRQHPSEFQQLVAWQREGLLDITWINHSEDHPVGADFSFLTDPKIDFRAEVTNLEADLLREGCMPSLLFRFPGLTHNAARRAELRELGLFALDANGWLAKNEPLANGTVVLVHGNGNEAQGITKYFDLMSRRAAEYARGSAEFVSPLYALPELPGSLVKPATSQP
jgi:hypothetical protein